MTVKLKEKSLLVIAPDYPDANNKFSGCNYVKRMLNWVAPKFNKVTVIAPVLPTFGITPQSRFCNNYQYNNVSVYFPHGYYIPNRTPGQNKLWKSRFDFRYNAIDRVIKSEKIDFDIIHAQFAYMSGHVAEKLHMHYNVPYVVTVYEDPVWLTHLLNLGDKKYISALKNAACTIGINNTDTQRLSQFSKRVRCIHMGYDNSRFFCSTNVTKAALRHLGHLSLRDKIVVSVGNLEHRKRFDLLIKAVSSVSAVDKCFIIGNDKGDLQNLKALINNHHLNHKVKIRTDVDDEKLKKYMSVADVVTVQSDSEGFGITQIEAMACGKPVVASDTVGSIDVITPETGLLFKCNDLEDLKAKLELALTRTWDESIICAHAHEYAWSEKASEVCDVYRRTLSGNW